MVVTDPAEGDQLLDAVQRRANNLGRLALAGELEREEEGLDLDARRVRLRQHGRRFRRLLDCRKTGFRVVFPAITPTSSAHHLALTLCVLDRQQLAE